MEPSRDQGCTPPSPLQPGERIGLIAGNGRFPIIFAENATRLGLRVTAIAHVGETESELERHVDRIHWIQVGQLSKIIHALKGDSVRQAVMLGGVKKTNVFSVRPDVRALALFSRLKHWKDDVILREFAAELEQEGIQVRESTFGLQGILVEEGTVTKRSPSHKEWEDVQYGWEVACEVGRLDIGQCVVIKDRVIISVEAVEGTDEAIRRGGALAQDGAVVVKRCKPQQDLRFDLPAVGPKTIETMQAVKAGVLALEAGRGILLDRDDTIRLANQAKIAIVGLAS